MRKKNTKLFIKPITLFLLFLLFTISVKFVDVQALGPQQAEVGYGTLNKLVFKWAGSHSLWAALTDIMEIAALLVAVYFAGKGAWQLWRRKGLSQVDWSILGLGGIYFLLLASYLFFEKVIVNYRPVLIDQQLEASYPSSHVLLVVTIMLTAVLELKHRPSEKRRVHNISYFLLASAFLTVIGRLLAGVHWFTDIVGSLLLSGAFIQMYHSFLVYTADRKAQGSSQRNRKI